MYIEDVAAKGASPRAIALLGSRVEVVAAASSMPAGVNPSGRADRNAARWPLGELIVISIRSALTVILLLAT